MCGIVSLIQVIWERMFSRTQRGFHNLYYLPGAQGLSQFQHCPVRSFLYLALRLFDSAICASPGPPGHLEPGVLFITTLDY